MTQMTRPLALAAILVMLASLVLSMGAAAAVEIADVQHTLNDDGSITVSCTITGDLDNAYVEYKVCADGMCSLKQKADLVQGTGDGYSATIGPFEEDEEVEFNVIAYDAAGTKKDTEPVDIVMSEAIADDDKEETPGFEAACLVSAIALVGLAAYVQKRKR